MEDGGKREDADLPNSTGDPQLDEAARRWFRWDRNPWTRTQMKLLLEAGLLDEVRSRLSERLSFGTAGLRAPMGAGFNRINDLTVIQATQGLLSYLCRCFPDLSGRGVVVGFDARGQQESGCSSHRLAQLAAAVMLSRDVPVHLFSGVVPTPYVPFAVRTLGAAAGVMITASHNPKEDNGYKVYWCSGAQVASPQDKEILRSMEEEQEPWSASCWEAELCQRSSLCRDPLTRINRCYMDQLSSLCFHRVANCESPLRVVHSSFHGVGHAFVRQAFQVFGLAPPIPVPEQRDPDPSFPTVRCPNPEEGACVLELALRLAEKEDAGIVLATDPDADRLAVAETCDGCFWKVFSGNELAALLGWWMFFNWKQNAGGATAPGVCMLATAVSSRILQTMARAEGFHYEETLPGFKWIGNRIHKLSAAGRRVLFSFEESIGFLCGDMVPEKDGVSAAAVVAEMAAYLQRAGLSLTRQLHIIYQTYGYHLSRTSYVTCHDPHTVHRIFSRIRNFHGAGSYPHTCGGVAIEHVRDVTTGYDSSRPDLRSTLPVSRSGQMVTFCLQNGVVATLRTSGTEPKIKFYAELCAPPGQSDVSALEEELQRVTAGLLDEFLEPQKNKLIGRCD